MTDVIHSIGATNSPTTMDYSTLATWAAAAPADITAAGSNENWIGEVYNQGEMSLSGYGNYLNLTSTSDPTHRVILRAGTGQGFKDISGAATNPLRYNGTTGAGAAITSNVPYGVGGISSSSLVFFELAGLQLRNTNSSGNLVTTSNGNNQGANIHGCIFSDAGGASPTLNMWMNTSGNSSACIIENNIFIQETRLTTYTLELAPYTWTVRNNTIVALASGTNTGYGIYGVYTNNNIYNNAFFGIGVPIRNASSGGSGSNNITDQTSFGTNPPASPGTTSAAFTTANFIAVSGVTYGTGTGYDFRIPSGSALTDAGSSTYGSLTDILGTTRPQGTTADIGAFEYVAPVVTTPPPSGGALSVDPLGSVGEQLAIPIDVLSLYNNITDANALRSDALSGTVISASFATDANPSILFQLTLLLTR